MARSTAKPLVTPEDTHADETTEQNGTTDHHSIVRYCFRFAIRHFATLACGVVVAFDRCRGVGAPLLHDGALVLLRIAWATVRDFARSSERRRSDIHKLCPVVHVAPIIGVLIRLLAPAAAGRTRVGRAAASSWTVGCVCGLGVRGARDRARGRWPVVAVLLVLIVPLREGDPKRTPQNGDSADHNKTGALLEI